MAQNDTIACAGTVMIDGKPLSLLGTMLNVKQAAPAFSLLKPDLSEVSLSDFAGKPLLISTVASLDTGVCNKQTLRLNEEALKIKPAAVLTVSMDLPPAQKRWVNEAGITNLVVASAHRSEDFGLAYGVLIEGIRLLTRAVFVVAADGTLRYREVVPELGRLPDFDAALEAVRRLL